MSTTTPSSPVRTHTPPGGDRVDPLLVGCVIAIVAIFTWLFWPFLYRQFQYAIQQQADWGHTLVIPFISCWFVYLNRQKIFAEPFQIAWTGLVLVFLGMGIYTMSAIGLDTRFYHHNIMGFGVGATLFGLVLFFCGWRAMRWLWFPTLYVIVFGQTVSDSYLEMATYKLQDIAAVGSFYGLSLIGFEVDRAGNTLQIFYEGELVPVNIAEACSGMRMLVAFLALGVAMAYRGLDYTWQRVVLVLMAIPTAVFVNVLRVMTLGILATQDSGFAAGDFHSMVGLLWLVPAFFIYLGIMWVLRHLVVGVVKPKLSGQPPAVDVRFSPGIRTAFVTSVVILVAGGLAFEGGVRAWNIHLTKEAVPPRHALDSIPYTIGSWTSSRQEEARMDAAGEEQLGTSLYLTRRYVNGEDASMPAVQLHLAYYTGGVDTVPHVPDRCMVAGGLTQEQPQPENLELAIDVSQWALDPQHTLDGEPYRLATIERGTAAGRVVRLPIGEYQIRTTEFGDPDQPDLTIFAGYFFITNGRQTPTPWGVKSLAFGAQDKKAYYCKVQLTTVTTSPMTAQEFLELASSFLEPMIPEIMRVLPDWVEESAPEEPESA
ncbi:MAG: exosortase-associated EpsI family protein [Phycisphaerales bacterium]|nr:exosortase-associated EpsI family protein [Phycisphaerales bacterium]